MTAESAKDLPLQDLPDAFMTPDNTLETDQTRPDAIAEDSGRDINPQSCDFEPGPTDHPVMDNWGERTVDRQDLAKALSEWKLTVDGLVDNPQTFTFYDLRDLNLSDHVVDFHCVEGWSIYDVPWTGFELSRLLDIVSHHDSAKYLKITCFGGTYTESLSISVAREAKTLLALGIGGNTLPQKHGFPCRIVVPRLFGYKSPKYVERTELVTTEHVGFWPRFGYAVKSEVPDNRLREGKY